MSDSHEPMNLEVEHFDFSLPTNDPNDPNEPNKKSDMIDWWVGTVLLTFFPILTSIIISLCRNGYVDYNRMIGDGELILSAFLVITPSIMNFYKTSSVQENRTHKLIFYLLLFVAFFQLTAYTSIKTALNNKEVVVYITSGLCVLSSTILSWRGEKFLVKGNNK